MSGREDKSDILKRALAVTLKALGRKPDLEVAFSTTTGFSPLGRVKLPDIPPDCDPQSLFEARGAADSAAFFYAFHSPDLAATQAPQNPTARAVFDALERARCEAFGGRSLSGALRNMQIFYEHKVAQAGWDKATVMMQIPAAEAVHLLALQHFSGRALPAGATQAAALWRTYLYEKGGPFMDGLAASLSDQSAFGQIALRLLETLSFVPPEADDPDSEPAPKPSDPDEDAPDQDEAAQESEDEGQASATTDADEDAATEEQDKPSPESDGGMPDESDSFTDYLAPPTTYRIFTSLYDETVEADQLCDPAELAHLRGLLDRQVRRWRRSITRLANRLQRRLQAEQLRSWDFDLEEGILDAAKLARVVTNPLQPLSFKQEKETTFRDTVVTLLIDNSGSMRGRPITLAAISADILARTLERCGVKVEILGFTTRTWKGGRAREDWLRADRPTFPGRLNELRHIVYKAADAPWRRVRRHLGLMLREGLLKENIDGEALLWACQRLRGRLERRKILMVISDGAPVDDATLAVNPQNYLDEHLKSVIAWIEKTKPVELAAIGIGHDVTRYYSRAVTISDAEQLGGTMTEQLAALFEETR